MNSHSLPALIEDVQSEVSEAMIELRRWTRQVRPDVQWVKRELSDCHPARQLGAVVRDSDSTLPIDLEVHYSKGSRLYEVAVHVVCGAPTVTSAVRSVVDYCNNAQPSDRVRIPVVARVNNDGGICYYRVTENGSMTATSLDWVFGNITVHAEE